MPGFDDRLTRELERAGRPANPAGAFERIERKHARRGRVRKVQAGVLVVVVLAGTASGFVVLSRAFRGGGTTIGTTPAVTNGAIVYEEIRDAGGHLWVIQPDGNGAHQLTSGSGSDTGAAISADGRTVAFVKTDSSGSWIYTIGIDGTGQQPLHVSGIDPAWSPDGSSIAFVRPDGGVFVVTADGSGVRQIVDSGFVASHPTWSPDGSHIAFAAPSSATGADRNYDLWITDVQGVTQTNITASTGSSELSPSWSPDGSLILFSSSTPFGASLMTMTPDPDAIATRLTDGSRLDLDPSWSPDGKFIVFDRTDSSSTSIYSATADGSDIRFIATGASSPAWETLPAGSSAPQPTTSPSSSGPVDIGVAFPVCHVQTMTGDFDGNGTLDTFYTATKMSDASGCPAPGTATEVLAVDLNGDGKVDASGGPPACPGGCEPFAAPDIEGDGTAEIAIVIDRPADGTERIQLWRSVPAHGPDGSTAILPLIDSTGMPATFSWGSDGTNTYGVSCTTRTTPPLLIAWQATPTGTASWRVSEHGYHIVGTDLTSTFEDNYNVPGEETAFPDGGGSTMCGAPVVATP